MLQMSYEKDAQEVLESTIERLYSLGALRKEFLYERLDSDSTRCNICQRRCIIKQKRTGYCKTKLNISGDIYTTIYGVISSAAADPIEKKPVFHYKPGSICYSVGSLGCNFRCVFCQNWQIAYADGCSGCQSCAYGYSPDKLVSDAKKHNAEGVAWTYNEPAIWLSYALDCAKLCKQNDLYTVYVTNGYATPEGLDAIAPYLDVYRVDLKSFSDNFYNQLIRVPSAAGIFDVAHRARQKWDLHVECVTNIVPGWNDDIENLQNIANWIADKLGDDTPWHVTRFFPHAKMKDIMPTPLETIELAIQIGKKAGLKFVYPGNANLDQNTYCPSCGKLIAKRSFYDTRLVLDLEEGKCPNDGTYINIKI